MRKFMLSNANIHLSAHRDTPSRHGQCRCMHIRALTRVYIKNIYIHTYIDTRINVCLCTVRHRMPLCVCREMENIVVVELPLSISRSDR